MLSTLTNAAKALSTTSSDVVSGIADVAKAIHACAVSGVSVPPEILSRLDEFIGGVSELNHNIEKVSEDGVKHNVEISCGGLFSWIYENKNTIGIFAVIFIILLLLGDGGKKVLVTSLCAVVTALIVTNYSSEIRDRWQILVVQIADYFSPYQPQMFDTPIVKSLLLFGYICTFKTISTETLTSKFNSFVKVMTIAPGKAESMGSTLTYYAKIVQDLFNSTMKWIGLESSVNLFGDPYPQATALIEECNEFLRTSASDRDLLVSRAAQTSQVLQNQIVSMMVKNKADRDFVGTQRILCSLRSKLENFDRELDLRGAGRSVTRVAPKAFLFMGKPGIGKSYLLRTLCTMLLYKLFEKDPIALKRIESGQTRDFIFTRNSDDKFWEGYYNQTIVYLDEVAMARDVAGSNSETNEYSSFIKMVNDVCFPLPMANVEKKGTCEFDSDVILGTTNAINFTIESINNRDAYDRRWIKFEVEVNPDFGYLYSPHEDGRNSWYRPDFSKLAECMSIKDVALSKFLRFRERRSLFNHEVAGDWFGIDELIERMRREVQAREFEKKANQNHVSILNSIFGVPSEKAPGSFEPQMKDCRCKVCNLTSYFDSESRFLYSEIFGGIPHKTLESAFMEGYRVVLDEKHMLYTDKPMCIHKLVEKYPSFSAVDAMFLHGNHVRSAIHKRDFLNPIDSRIDALIDTCKKVLYFVSGITGIYGIYRLLSSFFGKSDDCVAIAPEATVESQYTDLNAQEVISCVLKRNVYALSFDGDVKGFGTFICDNIILVPRHFVITWKAENDKGNLGSVSLRRLGDGSNHQVITFDSSVLINDENIFYPVEGGDLAAIYLDNRCIQRHASLKKYLMSADMKQNSGEVIFPHINSKDLKCTLKNAGFSVSRDIGYSCRGTPIHLKRSICYRYPTVSGDCGLPVAIKDPLIRCQKIFGLHVSGAPSMGIGVSTPFTIEMFDEVVSFFEAKYNIIQSQYRIDAQVLLDMQKDGKSWNDLFQVPEDKEIPGKVNLGYLEPARVPSTSAIRPSPLFKKLDFDPKTKPARLREFTIDDKVIDPNMIATEKYHHSVAEFNLPILDLCKNDVSKVVLNGPLIGEDSRMGKRVLTFEEAVAGIAGVEGFYGIPRKTSAGYPRCMTVDKRGKRDFFGDKDDYEFDSPAALEVRANVEDIVARATRLERGNHVFFDFPKDERRPKAKVDAGKTRKISACPVDLAIAIRMYFGCFVQFFMKNRIFNQSAVGVNVFDKQWDLIADYLGVDSRVIAGDFSNYDGRLPYCVMIRFLDTVTDYYGDRGSDAEKVREVLFQELVNSRHIMNGVIYEWVGSNASGNPLTTVLNSWCNLVLLRYATLICAGISTVREANQFLSKLDDHVRYMVYGDDNLISVKRDSYVAEFLTQDNLTSAFSQMGLEYTDESKSGVQISQDRGIEDVSFLKRKWAKNSLSSKRRYLSPLDLNTILESVQWTKKKDVYNENVKINVVNMLQELSQHDRSTFDEWAPKIVAASREHLNFVPIPNTYEDCQVIVLSRDMDSF